MLLGKVPGGGFSPFISSSPKTPPFVAATSVNNPDDLSEVVVTAKAVPITEDIPEIVVEGRRIPWYVWAIAGGVAYIAAARLLGGR